MTDAPLFTNQFEAAKATLPQGDAPWRQAAFDRFATLGMPSQKREAWRHTSLARLKDASFDPASAGTPSHESLLLDGAIHLIFRDGVFDAAASAGLHGVLGVTLTTIAKALDEGGDSMLDAMSRAGDDNPDNALVSLNEALLADGICIDVADNAAIDAPIQLVFVGSGTMAHSRNLVRVGAGAKATLVESWVGNGAGWNNVVNQVSVAEGASLDHIRLVAEDEGATNIAQSQVVLGEGATYEGFVLLSGGQLLRHELQAEFTGPNAHCGLAGIGLGRGKDVRDVVSHVDHAMPDCTSAQTVRNVMDDHAQSVFQGKVTVQQDAQRTDAQQSNKNMLLARTAVANTKPELVIFADDVKCAHGATVGELDEDQLFYLQARGLDEESARQLLIEGFIADIFDFVAHEALRDQLREIARNWLGAAA